MTKLIIKNDIGKKKMEGLLLFLKSWDIDAEIISVAKKYNAKKIRIVNRPDALSDEQLFEKLSGEVSDTFSCSDDDCREIVEVPFVFPGNQIKIHPALVLSTEQMNG